MGSMWNRIACMACGNGGVWVSVKLFGSQVCVCLQCSVHVAREYGVYACSLLSILENMLLRF